MRVWRMVPNDTGREGWLLVGDGDIDIRIEGDIDDGENSIEVTYQRASAVDWTVSTHEELQQLLMPLLSGSTIYYMKGSALIAFDAGYKPWDAFFTHLYSGFSFWLK